VPHNHDSQTPITMMGDLGTVLDALLGGHSSQRQRNVRWLQSGTPIWVTGGAAVGICPGNDDFLIWTDLQKKGLVKIPATAEVIADFYARLMPLIKQHRQVAAALNENEWEHRVNHTLTVVVPAVVAGKLAAKSSPAKPNTSGLTRTYDDVVAGLGAFAKRWNARPSN
jgi:hypothetical protein